MSERNLLTRAILKYLTSDTEVMQKEWAKYLTYTDQAAGNHIAYWFSDRCGDIEDDAHDKWGVLEFVKYMLQRLTTEEQEELGKAVKEALS